MAKNTESKIRRAADLYFEGLSFKDVGVAMKVATTTVHRWSKSDIWKQETEALQDIQAAEHQRIYRKSIEKHRKQLEVASLTGIQLSLELLVKMKQLTSSIDVEEIEDIEAKIKAFSTLANCFDKLLGGSKTLYTEVLGLDCAIESLIQAGILANE